MFYYHKEGRKIIWVSLLVIVAIGVVLFVFVRPIVWPIVISAVLLLAWFVVSLFFRIPHRQFVNDSNRLLAPADGKVVTIEDTVVKEYIDGECRQISIFMNGTDVHVNRYPCDGIVEYYRYHKGNYFVASYPKSSTLNEHSSVGLRLPDGQKILIRQIAGTMARRIACYAKENLNVRQNQEMGFIKFGSRVDVFVPKHFKMDVDINAVVRNATTPICTIVPAPATESSE